MTGPDFLDNFNLLYNNVMSNQAPGLDVTEIALFLTKAEQELIKDYFNPKSNPKQEGYSDSPQRISDFMSIVNTIDIPVYSNEYTLSDNEIVFIVNEEVDTLPLILISPEEYDRVRTKPYPFPQKRLVWKVAIGNNTFKLIYPGILNVVSITYIRLPKPFDGERFYYQDNPCELPEYMHSEVVQRAVELAKTAWLGDLNSALNIGQRIE